MSVPLPVQLTAAAARQMREAERWWRLNRPGAPNAIREELQRVLPILALQPQIGVSPTNVKLGGVRRVHMRPIRYHLYYHVTGAPEFVEVLALWHSSRGSGPPI